MNVYIISDDNALVKHWKRSLRGLSPIVAASFDDIVIQEGSVVFVSDTLPSRYDGFRKNKLMILSRMPDFMQAEEYLKKGAMGYGNAMMHGTHLLSAYKALDEGKVWLHPDFVAKLILQVREHNHHKEVASHKLDVLSPREREVAILLSSGKSHLEISEELSITVRTIKAHSTSIFEKLNLKDRLALSVALHA